MRPRRRPTHFPYTTLFRSLDVMKMHRDAVKMINRTHIPGELYESAWQIWSDAVDMGELNGYRNSQASVLAPTGTIGFMIDRKSTRLNSSHVEISYAVFCLK